MLNSYITVVIRTVPGIIYFYFFPHPFIVFARLFSLPPSRNSDRGSHSRLFSPPTHYGSCRAFLSREDFSSSLVDSRRKCAYPRRALSAVDRFFIFANKFKISPRRDSNSRTNTSSIRGLPLVHQGDRLRTYVVQIYSSNSNGQTLLTQVNKS